MDLGVHNGLFTNTPNGVHNGFYIGTNNGVFNGVYNEDLIKDNIVKSGLVLYMDAGNLSSAPTSGLNVWRDISGNVNNGTFVNSPSFNVFNKSIKFNGTSNYIDCGSNSVLNFTSTLTLSHWFLLNDTTNTNMLATRERIPGISNKYTFHHLSGGLQPRLLIQNGATSVDATSSTILTGGKIYNFTSVLTTSQIIHYINGKLDSTFNSSGFVPNYASANNWLLGASQGSAIFYGNQNQFMTLMYNRDLNAAEVAANFNATKSRFNL